MQYAIVEGQRREAFAGGKGVCPICAANTIAKCGPRVLHHWAHSRIRDCDPWWENETPWHRQWKNLFPEDSREVNHVASDGEIHRADVKTPTGIVLEIQHSSMTDEERISREQFYGNLIWIIDGSQFKGQFVVFHHLPDPNSELAKDVVWYKATRQMHGAAEGLFWRRSENPEWVSKMVQVHGIREIENAVRLAYRGHHQYDWVRPHRTWLDAKCPVYIDFGSDKLVRLEIYNESGLPCVRLISKRKFVHDVMTESLASAVGTNFYPIRTHD